MKSSNIKTYSTLLVIITSIYIGNFAYAAPQSNIHIQNIEKAKVSNIELNDSLEQINEIKKIQIKKELPLQAFHSRADIQESDKDVFCFQCHTNPPHRKNEVSRTFQNMHTRFMDCSTCHYKAENKKLIYQWLDKDNQAIALNKIMKNKALLLEKSLDAKNQKAKQSENISIIPELDAKITATYKQHAVNILSNSDFAQTLKETWEKSDARNKAHIKVTLHQTLNDNGTACKSCHSDQQTWLNWQILGASKKQIKSIEKNPIPRFIDKANQDGKRIQLNGLLD